MFTVILLSCPWLRVNVWLGSRSTNPFFKQAEIQRGAECELHLLARAILCYMLNSNCEIKQGRSSIEFLFWSHHSPSWQFYPWKTKLSYLMQLYMYPCMRLMLECIVGVIDFQRNHAVILWLMRFCMLIDGILMGVGLITLLHFPNDFQFNLYNQ